MDGLVQALRHLLPDFGRRRMTEADFEPVCAREGIRRSTWQSWSMAG